MKLRRFLRVLCVSAAEGLPYAAILLGLALAACASHKKPQGVADVPECRSAANAALPSEFESKLDNLRRQADAYSDCMSAHGYALDQDRLDDEVLHLSQVQWSDRMRGDPYDIVETHRQQLRLSPSMWRSAGAPNS